MNQIDRPTRMKLNPSSRRYLHVVSNLLKPADEAVGGLVGISAVEVSGAQVVPFGAVAQHVELFFKWIKQHLRIKKFLGTSENAVKTQIWCAVSTYAPTC